MQNVVALIKLAKQVSLVCFSWALYRVARVMGAGEPLNTYLYFFKTLASFTSMWPLIFSYSESHKSRRIVM